MRSAGMVQGLLQEDYEALHVEDDGIRDRNDLLNEDSQCHDELRNITRKRHEAYRKIPLWVWDNEEDVPPEDQIPCLTDPSLEWQNRQLEIDRFRVDVYNSRKMHEELSETVPEIVIAMKAKLDVMMEEQAISMLSPHEDLL